MKEEIYIIKAVESKGYNIKDLVLLSTDEIKSLPISYRLIEGVLAYRDAGAPSVEEIEEKIFDQKYNSDIKEVPPVVINDYVQNTEEQAVVLETIKEEAREEIPEDVIVIEQKVSDKADVDIIKDALQQKEIRSVAKYIKLLKDTVPSAILTSVDSSLINELIEARISEVKTLQENAK